MIMLYHSVDNNDLCGYIHINLICFVIHSVDNDIAMNDDALSYISKDHA